MRAIVYDKYGPPDVLHLEEVDTPVPGDDEILVRVHATAVTAADYRIRGSNFPTMFWLPGRIAFGLFKPKRRILGNSLAGEVVAVGKDVTRFREGEQVYGTASGGFGAYAEYIRLPEKAALTTKPDNVTYEEAAAIPFGAHTALYFLRDKGHIRSGQRVLIYGASGGVGTASVQIAKYYGADVTGVSSTANLGLVTSLGADRVIDYTREDFTEEGETYDLIFETVGKSSVTRGMRVLKPGGVYLANVIGPSTLVQMVRTWKFGNKKVVGGIAPVKPEDLALINEMLESGALRAIIDRRYPFEQTAEAHRYAETGHKKGNVVITLQHDG